MQIIVALLAISDYLLIHGVWHMRRSGPQPPLKYCIGLVGSRNVQARHAPYGDSPSRRYGVTPRKQTRTQQERALVGTHIEASLSGPVAGEESSTNRPAARSVPGYAVLSPLW